MAHYRITDLSYIDEKIVKDGEEITVPDSVIPGPHWMPLDDSAKRAAKDVKPGKVNPFEDALS